MSECWIESQRSVSGDAILIIALYESENDLTAVPRHGIAATLLSTASLNKDRLLTTLPFIARVKVRHPDFEECSERDTPVMQKDLRKQNVTE